MKQGKIRQFAVAAAAVCALFVAAGCKDDVTEEVNVEYVINNQTGDKYKVQMETNDNGSKVQTMETEVDANKNTKMTLPNIKMLPVGSRTITALYWKASETKPAKPGKDAADAEKDNYNKHVLTLTVTNEHKLTDLYIRPKKSGSSEIVFTKESNYTKN